MSSIHPSDNNNENSIQSIQRINVVINESHLTADGFIRTKLPNGAYGYYLPTKNKTQKKQQNESLLCLLY